MDPLWRHRPIAKYSSFFMLHYIPKAQGVGYRLACNCQGRVIQQPFIELRVDASRMGMNEIFVLNDNLAVFHLWCRYSLLSNYVRRANLQKKQNNNRTCVRLTSYIPQSSHQAISLNSVLFFNLVTFCVQWTLRLEQVTSLVTKWYLSILSLPKASSLSPCVKRCSELFWFGCY